MFPEIIFPVFRSTRLCYSLWYNAPTMLPAFPKHVKLTGIINKPLLLHLAGCLYYLYQWCTVKQISDNEIYLLIKYTKIVLWRVTKRLSYIEEARCLKVKAKRYSELFLPGYENVRWRSSYHVIFSSPLLFRSPLGAILRRNNKTCDCYPQRWHRLTQSLL